MPEDLPSSREIDWETIVRKAWATSGSRKKSSMSFLPPASFIPQIPQTLESIAEVERGMHDMNEALRDLSGLDK